MDRIRQYCDSQLEPFVDALEEEGLSQGEYQLHQWVDIEALERLIESADADLEVRFSVAEFQILVTQSEVQVASSPS
ncbi:hypothetical protein SAMN04488556_4058 [Halostagnicola kamekurae]|uniref:Halobacterial output domain-containing protein n=1 Tax=Halostagnicola kamekurae TaxID=619731 RepID=A0A1I6USK8_9EURY|nr:hypothetical protein SAMN04488556_4058 [Halostagnicola kamekurae]